MNSRAFAPLNTEPTIEMSGQTTEMATGPELLLPRLASIAAVTGPTILRNS